MNLSELITTMAILEERGELEKLDEIGSPPGNVIQWLFGLTSGFYFADGETRQIRQSMLGLALRYYDLVESNTNLLSFNERTRRISAGKHIEEYLSQREYDDERETASFYIRHMPKQALRSTDPVHDYFTALLPGAGYRGGNGVVFQVGERPVFGDLNKGRVPAAYRAVNDFLKPLRYENWERAYLRAPCDVDKMEYTEWWTHRFDGGER
ncbi:type VI immunity family protein [Agrobacterium sp. LAD9]|uniref:type VI immunity family protein n=1 Tax=Agrobacterium sp. LAD9 TaxID=2055153 RepID=UPI0018646D1C|nr:type VI immunity family protein [Agrobacterium sp. LAD9]